MTKSTNQPRRHHNFPRTAPRRSRTTITTTTTEQNIRPSIAVSCLCLPINTMSLINFHNLLPLQRIPDPASSPTYQQQSAYLEYIPHGSTNERQRPRVHKSTDGMGRSERFRYYYRCADNGLGDWGRMTKKRPSRDNMYLSCRTGECSEKRLDTE